jgi:hypothetical protein
VDIRFVSGNFCFFSSHRKRSSSFDFESHPNQHFPLVQSGRACDIYTPSKSRPPSRTPHFLTFAFTVEPIFIAGNLILGAFSLGTGFIRTKIPFFILRSLAGIGKPDGPVISQYNFLISSYILGASCTIPSALSMIIRIFPDPKEQAMAISIFGATGAIGNGTNFSLDSCSFSVAQSNQRFIVIGLLLGAVFTQFASWHWIFWFIACVTLPVAIFCVFYIPNMPRQGKRNSLDIVGVSLLIGEEQFLTS